MGSFIYFSLVASFFYAFMIILMASGQRDKLINSFIGLLTTMLCWTAGSFLMRILAAPGYIFWYHVSLFGIVMLGHVYFEFIRNFFNEKKQKRDNFYAIIALILFLINIPSGIFLRWPELITDTSGTVSFVYHSTPLVIILFAGALLPVGRMLEIIYTNCKANDVYFKQIKPLLIGIAILILGNICVNLTIFAGFPIDLLSGVINALFMLYTLIKKHIFKTKRLVTDGVCYGVSAILTLSIFYSMSADLMQAIDYLFPNLGNYKALVFAALFQVAAWSITLIYKAIVKNIFVKKDYSNIYETYAAAIDALTETINAKDHYTYSHSKNVAYYATCLAKALGYTDETIEIIHQAALLHDIGKISIPESILQKRAGLTIEEYKLMKTHVESSVQIISRLPDMDYVIPAVAGHHERYDGTGYPNGLKGNEIPATARLLCIADSFDAMVSKRCYKEKMPVEQAIQELKNQSGKQFDPDMATAFIQLIEKGKIVVFK